ncbi:MAG: hypothetical protein D5S00_08995, partial [Tindallia sp. MSAO_Bac2]
NGNLDGFNYEEYLTGAVPGDADITEPTLTATGDVSAVQVATNNGQWIGVFPPDGTLGTPGGPGGGGATPATATQVQTATGGATATFAAAAEGNLLVAVVGMRQETAGVPTMAGGWSLAGSAGGFASDNQTGTRHRVAIFYKVADGGETSTGTVTWTGGGSTGATRVYEFTGAANWGSPSTVNTNSAFSERGSIPFTGTVGENRLGILAVGSREAMGSPTAAGFTMQNHVAGDVGVATGRVQQASALTVPTYTITGTNYMSGLIVQFQPTNQ